jgi:hypothetical protein
MTIWTWDRATGTWVPDALPDRPYALTPAITLIPVGGRRYGVLASERLRVNGEPVLPLRVLEDRDELAWRGDGRCYVSLDDAPEVVPFPADAGPCRCARCGGAIAPGTPSVQCPRCGCRVHATEARPCWGHGPSCAACPQPTVGRAWEPEPLTLPSSDSMDRDDA